MVLVPGDGKPGFSDSGPVRFNKPIRLASYGYDAILVADIYNHALRIATIDGRVRTVVGGPEKMGYGNGPARVAMFNSPHGVAFDPSSGEIVVAEAGSRTIRRFTPIDTVVPLSRHSRHLCYGSNYDRLLVRLFVIVHEIQRITSPFLAPPYPSNSCVGI